MKTVATFLLVDMRLPGLCNRVTQQVHRSHQRTGPHMGGLLREEEGVTEAVTGQGR